MITTGTYINPMTRKPFTVDREWLQDMANTANAMAHNGVRIPIAKDHNVDVDNTIGYARDFFVDKEGWLNASYEFGDEADEKLAKKIGQVSISWNKTFVDGRGNTYERAIREISLTPLPVVPNQKGFVEAELRQLDNTMKYISLSLKETNTMDYGNFTELLGTKVSDDNLFEVVESKLEELADAKKSLSSSKREVKKLTSLTLPQVDELTLDDRAQNFSERFDRCVEDAKLNDIDCTAFKDALIGEAGNRVALALTSNGGTQNPLTLAILKIVENFAPRVSLKEKSGPQAELSLKGRDGKAVYDRNASFAVDMRNAAGIPN